MLPAYVCFLAALLFSPVAFATVEIWSMGLAQGLLFSSLAFALFSLALKKDLPWRKTPGIIPLLLLCGFILFQTVPLPPGLLKLLSPKAADIYHHTFWLLKPGGWAPLSLDRKATLIEFFRIGSAVAVYVLTVQLLRNKQRVQITLAILAAWIGALAVLSILQKFSANGLIYWVRPVEGDNPMGPWVNRNHYAGFMSMSLPVLLALFLIHKPEIRYQTSWRKRLTLLLAMPESNLHVLFGFDAILVAISVFLSLSRGGIVSMVLSLLVFCSLLLSRRYSSKNIFFISMATGVMLLGVSWFGWQPIVERFEKTINADGQIADQRPEVWQDTLGIITDYPLTGAGFGSFEDIYRGYRTVEGRGVFSHAHNDYLEVFTDGGLIAAGCIAVFLWSLIRTGIRASSRRHDRFFILLFQGALCSILAILAHSVTDFNLHISANIYYFFFYCGIMTTAATTSHHRKAGAEPSVRKNRNVFLAATLLSLVLLISTLFFHTRELLALQASSALQNTFLYQGMSADRLKQVLDLNRQTLLMDPLESRFWLARGNILHLGGQESARASAYQKAVELTPLSCSTLQQTALFWDTRKPTLAKALFATSRHLNPQQADCTATYAEFLLSKGKRQEALAQLRDAMALEPTAASYYFPLLRRNRVTPAEITAIFPPNADTYCQYAALLWNNGEKEQGLAMYEKGRAFWSATPVLRPWHFTLGYRMYTSTNKEDQSLELIQEAVGHLPDDGGLRELLGDLYQKRGILFRAREEYEKALALQPQKDHLLQKLDNISGK